MSSTATRYFVGASAHDELARADAGDLQSGLDKEPDRLTIPSVSQDEVDHSAVHLSCCSERSDEVLLSFICEGDRESLSLLFRRYARIVRGVAYRVLRDASEA